LSSSLGTEQFSQSEACVLSRTISAIKLNSNTATRSKRAFFYSTLGDRQKAIKIYRRCNNDGTEKAKRRKSAENAFNALRQQISEKVFVSHSFSFCALRVAGGVWAFAGNGSSSGAQLEAINTPLTGVAGLLKVHTDVTQ
jgi:hypothetical protein